MNPWICPRCQKVNAPWKDSCSCTPQSCACETATAQTAQYENDCNHEFFLIVDTPATSQYVCFKCGKIKIRDKKGDTDGDC